MWNFIAGFATCAVISTALLAWFIRSSKHSEELPPTDLHGLPATIQVRISPRYRTFSTSIDPELLRRAPCRYASNCEIATNINADKLNDADLNRMEFVRWCMAARGLFSED